MSDHHRDDLADLHGMAEWDGLYHGGRRLRAQIGYGAAPLLGLGWPLAPDEKDLIATIGYKEPAANTATSEVNFYRPSSPLTLTQGVKVAVDDEFVDKIWHNETLRFNVSQGVSEFETSVSLSLGLPNITGFNGARDYEQSFNLKQPKHFFKITFKPSLLGGQHVITEIDAKEFKEISKN